MMSGANERVEHRRPRVSRSAGQKDPHNQKPRLPIQCVYAAISQWRNGRWAMEGNFVATCPISHQMSQIFSCLSKKVMSPSSLTLRTAPKRPSHRGGRACVLDRERRVRLRRLAVQQDCADGEEPAGAVHHRCAIGPGQSGEHRGIQRGRRSVLSACAAAAHAWGSRRSVRRTRRADLPAQPASEANRRIAQHDEQGSLTRIREVQRGLEQTLGERVIADRPLPHVGTSPGRRADASGRCGS